jgi:hypothetical protein
VQAGTALVISPRAMVASAADGGREADDGQCGGRPDLVSAAVAGRIASPFVLFMSSVRVGVP